nr:hypothetical protein HK105_002167 [Polyrhizophydium stewartii]
MLVADPPASTAAALAALQLPEAVLPLLPALAALLPLAQAAQAHLDERIAAVREETLARCTILETAQERRITELEARLAASLQHAHEHKSPPENQPQAGAAPLAAQVAQLQHQVAELRQQVERLSSATPQPPAVTPDTPAARMPARPHANHFDRLPPEIKHKILRSTDLVTQVLSGYIDAATMTSERRIDFWTQLLDSGLDRDMSVVPFVDELPSMPKTVLEAIRSRAAFKRLEELQIPALKDKLQQTAIRNNWVDLVDITDKDALLRNACAAGTLEFLDYIVSHGLVRKPDRGFHLVDHVAGEGNLGVSIQLYDRQRAISEDAVDRAAKNGHYDVVVWALRYTIARCPPSAIIHAATQGHLGIVEYLHRTHNKGNSVDAADAAAANGHLEIVEWFYSGAGIRCSPSGYFGALQQGHQHVVDWLLANDERIAKFAPRK